MESGPGHRRRPQERDRNDFKAEEIAAKAASIGTYRYSRGFAYFYRVGNEVVLVGAVGIESTVPAQTVDATLAWSLLAGV